MTQAAVDSARRFKRRQPCPICGGGADLPQGRGVRCYGFLSDDGQYAYCSREELAGAIEQHAATEAYAHRLHGTCRCGQTHGEARQAAPQPRADRDRRVRRWEYRDGTGRLLARHARIGDGPEKKVWWETPDGRTSHGDVKPEALPLYGHERLSERPNDRVVLVEGEPAADAAWGHGLLAVTLSGGAKQPSFGTALEVLRGRTVVLWPDNDDKGRALMQRVNAALRGTATSVQWLDVPGLPLKGDAVDYFASGRTVEQLRALVREAPEIHSSEAPVVPDETILRFRTAREIAASVPPNIDWVSYPWVARGSVTEVDAKIKLGKSTWITHLCRAVLDGAAFMGDPTMAGPVVYLTEQPERSFRETLRRADLLERDDFHVLFWHDISGMDWEQVVQGAIEYALSVKAVLLAVDTLPQFAKLRGDAENNSGDALAAIQPLQQAAAVHNLGVLVVRHDRKSGGEVGDSARGSSAFGGAVDIVIQMRRPDGKAARPGIRVLAALSRFDETPDLLYVELTERGFVSIGSEAAVAERETREALLRAASTSEDAALASKDLLEAADNPKRTVAYAVLEQLVSEGLLRRVGQGKRGDPHRYWRPGIDSSALKMEVSDETFSSVPQRSEVALTFTAAPPAANGRIHSSETTTLRADESIPVCPVHGRRLSDAELSLGECFQCMPEVA